MFRPDYPIHQLKPAPYNPRKISEDDFERLQDSLKTLGCVKTIIAGQDHTIIAGHQRTRAMAAIGESVAPVYVINHPVSVDEEVRFNQLHNASDQDRDSEITVPQGVVGWTLINPGDIKIVARPTGAAAMIAEACRMIRKHGPWGTIVANEDGEVISGVVYAIACVALHVQPLVRYIDNADTETAEILLSGEYGVFEYGGLPQQTWAQGKAQRPRSLHGGRDQPEGKRRWRSSLYIGAVIPVLTKDMAVLDFGAGYGNYAEDLGAKGYRIDCFEPYKRVGHTASIDRRGVNRQIDKLIHRLETKGRYDMVVCDSVLNSVDSMEAEQAVLRSVSALCRPGGIIAFSGRSRAFVDRVASSSVSRTSDKRAVQMVDANGFTAMFSNGVWLKQMFHTSDDIRDRLLKNAGIEFHNAHFFGLAEPVPREHFERVGRASSWQVRGEKTIELDHADAEAALKFEFDLPYSRDERIGRADDVVRAYRMAVEAEQ